MATQQDLIRERELLGGLGLPPVRVWPPRCVWYRADGSVVGKLPCDPYSRLLYMGRGLRPDAGNNSPTPAQPARVTLLDAVADLMHERSIWEGTVSELLSTLEGATDDLPADATRLSKELSKLASQLALKGVVVERMTRRRQRGIRLTRRGPPSRF